METCTGVVRSAIAVGCVNEGNAPYFDFYSFTRSQVEPGNE
ncbi:MAG: hypothetical protein QQW96_08705 [Tychonema bourrellyi B0820]|nr:hypothetical protein [Tychonema bourrellyi B0820]